MFSSVINNSKSNFFVFSNLTKWSPKNDVFMNVYMNKDYIFLNLQLQCALSFEFDNKDDKFVYRHTKWTRSSSQVRVSLNIWLYKPHNCEEGTKLLLVIDFV